jgi:hypothetical protein
MLTIIGVYAPLEGKELETDECRPEAQEIIDKSNNEYFLLAGDFNP